MLLERFIKKNFISFFQKDDKYQLLKEVVKNNKIIDSEEKELNKKELKNYIKEHINQTPQTYISTILTTINQGAFDSCNRQKFKEEGITTDNLRIICINNSYSFYTSLYEINSIQKEFNVDFIYSLFAIIDANAKEKNNTLYALTLSNVIGCTIYYDNILKYADIIETIQNTDIDDINDIDDIDDILEDIDDDIVDLDEEMPEEENIENIDIEKKLIDFLKNSIKEYYNKGTDFIEKIVILDTLSLGESVKKMIEDEILIETTIEPINLLKKINSLSMEEDV